MPMLTQIIIGGALMLVTTVTHAAGMAVGLRWILYNYAKRIGMATLLKRSLLVGILVLIMFVTTLVEAAIWATTYFVVGAIPDFEKALYFSTVTYTTLGYGDIVLEEPWQLLSSFEAANGIIMFGWTTALIVVAIHYISNTLKKLEAIDE